MSIISTSHSADKKEHKGKKDGSLDSKATSHEKQLEPNLRPQSLKQYIGQPKLKELLKICISAATKRGDITSIGHILLHGAPGLGKTSCAMILAKEIGHEAKIFSAPALSQPKDIVGILLSLNENDVLFIDEIHRLNKITEELLYSSMEDYVIDLSVGRSQTARIMRLPINRFILVGATTRLGSLSSPLRDRFIHTYKMEFYSNDDLVCIIQNTSKILNFKITSDASMEIAQRSRGTPRITNRLTRLVRDYIQHNNLEIADTKDTIAAMELFKIDPNGLEESDKDLLRVVIEHYAGGPVGIEALAATLGEERQTIEDCYEPYLLQAGLLTRTPRGRMVTSEAYKLLNVPKRVDNTDQLRIGI